MSATDARRLDQWRPDEAWRPWQPSREQPWNLKWAGHLLRRAAFGFPALVAGEDAWDGLARVVRQGFDATLAELFRPAPAEFDELLDTIGEQTSLDNDDDTLRGWWLYRMLYTPQPLVERMTLFWHNHFATSVRKVRRGLWMFRQNQTLRRHALGRFGPLLSAMAHDPAMIVWLDLQRNVKGHANENFGRELMELFTLGAGHYTESDVRAAARAFTGWQSCDDQFSFNARLHDEGPKTLLGQTGNWNGDDVARIVLAQPAAARFIVRKLVRHFISEAETPTDALIEPLADGFRRSDYDVGQLTRRILSSRLFFSETAYRQRIKSPAEFVVGVFRGLAAKGDMPQLVQAMNGLGQNLFAPPSVAGWPGGKSWLNTATVLARDNLIWKLVGLPPDRSSPPGQPPAPTPTQVVAQYEATEPICRPERLIAKHAAAGVVQQIGFLVDLYLQGDIDGPAKVALVEYLNHGGPTGPERERRLRETLHLLLTVPDYQLA